MSESIEKLKAKRFQFLKKLWELSEGDEYKSFNMFEIGNELGFDHELTSSIYQYLRGEGLLKAFTLGGNIVITHAGIVEMEESLSKPDQPTEHFPAVNIINIGHMEHSNIIQGSSSVNQQNIVT